MPSSSRAAARVAHVGAPRRRRSSARRARRRAAACRRRSRSAGRPPDRRRSTGIISRRRRSGSASAPASARGDALDHAVLERRGGRGRGEARALRRGGTAPRGGGGACPSNLPPDSESQRNLTPSRRATLHVGVTLHQRVDELDWDDLTAQLDDRGFALTEPLLTTAECDSLAELFDGGRFRSTIDMARHRFGDGRYRYFEHPLPDRSRRCGARSTRIWRRSPTSGRRASTAARRSRSRHDELIERCAHAGQTAPDAADPALRPRRLERAAPGPLRRRLLPVPGPDRARRRLHRRRVRAAWSSGRAPRAARTCSRRRRARS